MKKKLLILCSMLVFSATFLAQQNYWKKFDSEVNSEVRDTNIRVNDQVLFTLNIAEIKNKLKNTPDRDYKTTRKGILLKFPDIDGNFETYEVFESSTMHPDLQNKYSEIRSYTGFKSNDKSTSLRFTIDPYFGFNGMIRNNEGIYYIDSYTRDNQLYRLYNRKDALSLNQFECLFNGDSDLKNPTVNSQKTVVDGLNRKYRLAITTTTEYTAYTATQAGVGGGTDAQKKAAVLAAVNLVVTRLNEVFERDIAVRLQLIANTDALFYINNDTFNTLNAGQMLNENITVTDNIIGAANYDIGHLFFKVDNPNNNNGLAATPAICGTRKAGGVTGSAAPVGDPFTIDFVAHEMGHQFGANHTQNNSCNRNNPTSIEPGSASSIMGYAGICPPNVQQNSDTYFHAVSIAEMYTRLTTGNTSVCGVKTSTTNVEPVVNAGLDRSIPKSTPFVLTATATDVNNDALTYTWEQTDAGAATMPPQPTNAVGPLFRSKMPSASSSRYFPKLSTIVSGYDPTIVLQTDERAWEKLSSVARNLSFSVLVRDNNAAGGQTGRDDLRLTVVNTAGPFVVTSQNSPGIIWETGQSQTITWDVANTTAAPVSTPNVSILLSTDGGLTFPHVLAANTPNDGSHTINVPGGLGNSSNARIMVKAVDNVFLNVNSQNITVNSTVISNPEIPPRIYQGLMIYPIPSYDGYVYIKLDYPRLSPLRPYSYSYKIYTMDGRLVIPKRNRLFFADHLEKIDLTNLPTETYMIEVELEGERIVKKLLMLNK